jgi:hypothetical protein
VAMKRTPVLCWVARRSGCRTRIAEMMAHSMERWAHRASPPGSAPRTPAGTVGPRRPGDGGAQGAPERPPFSVGWRSPGTRRGLFHGLHQCTKSAPSRARRRRDHRFARKGPTRHFASGDELPHRARLRDR